jgi:hypothetical protein
MPPTTTNGNTLRAIVRQRSRPALAGRSGAPATSMMVTPFCIRAGAPPEVLAYGRFNRAL